MIDYWRLAWILSFGGYPISFIQLPQPTIKRAANVSRSLEVNLSWFCCGTSSLTSKHILSRGRKAECLVVVMSLLAWPLPCPQAQCLSISSPPKGEGWEEWGTEGRGIFPQYESDHCFPVTSSLGVHVHTSGSSQSQGGWARRVVARPVLAWVGPSRRVPLEQVIDIVTRVTSQRLWPV